MNFDTDGSAMDVVRTAQNKANKMQKPYAIVLAPSGFLRAVPLDQCAIDPLEIIHQQES